jgi:magnesium chelatase subunit I
MTAAARSTAFPFTAIVGQEEFKTALTLNVVDPRIGGLMVMGHRGTGKSTTLRSLADVLPTITRAVGDPYNRTPADAGDPKLPTEKIGVPVVDLPLGSTEDRVCGTIDLEAALARGTKTFEPGLLAKANRGFLYIDEVNLLDDHLVDVLLDVAAGGVNTVEREGVSIKHPSRFVLVGSGNPEEGDLRPQLLDRFGLSVDIRTLTDPYHRMEVVKRRLAYDNDPVAFTAAYAKSQKALSARFVAAQKRVTEIAPGDDVILAAAELCVRLGIDGHRGELTIVRAAIAHAAFEGRNAVTVDDVRAVAPLALRHRLRRDPLEAAGDSDRIERALASL